jgi:hypothetical protein
LRRRGMAAYWTGNIVENLFFSNDVIIYSLIYAWIYFHGFPIIGDSYAWPKGLACY